MKKVIAIVVLGVLSVTIPSCFLTKDSDDRESFQPYVAPIEPTHLLKQDRVDISNCFIEYIEYFRLYHRYDLHLNLGSSNEERAKHNEHYSQHLGADWDPANFFEPYSSRFSLVEDKYVRSPIETKRQLTATTDAIVYRADSLICFALVILETHYDSISGLSARRDSGRKFDGKAVIGIRDSTSEKFKIYPVKNHAVIGFESYSAVSLEIRTLYFNKLKGKGLSGSVYRFMKHERNVNDSGFFETSPYFKKHISGLYNFQMYRHLAKDGSYKYLSCNSLI